MVKKTPYERMSKGERRLLLGATYGMGKTKLEKMHESQKLMEELDQIRGKTFTSFWLDEFVDPSAPIAPNKVMRIFTNPHTGLKSVLDSAEIEERTVAQLSGRGTPNMNLSAAAYQQLINQYNQYMNGVGNGFRQAYQAAHGGPTVRTNPEYYRAYTELTPGVTAGEITGYRAWSFNPRESGCLKSITADVLWDYEKPMEGDVKEWGIYSFKDPYMLMDAIGTAYNGKRIIYGKIKMWGEVIEHEHGHRAQFARISSLDYCKTLCFLRMAQHNYKFLELNEDEKRELDYEVNRIYGYNEQSDREREYYTLARIHTRPMPGGFR